MKRRVSIAMALAIAGVIGVMWWIRGRGEPVAEPARGSGSSGIPMPHVPRAPAAPASLAGRVTRAEGGGPIEGAVVSITRADIEGMFGRSQSPTIVVTTNASGDWVAPKVPAGTHIVAATANGFVPGVLAKLSLAPGEQRSGIALGLVAGGTLVHGSVTDVLGGPIGGARITLSRQGEWSRAEFVAVTGADGNYQLSLAPGPFRATAKHDDYTSKTRTIEVAGTPLVASFVLTPGGVIHGQVIARDTGKPIPQAQVRAQAGDMSQMTRGISSAEAIADESGTFTLRSLDPGAISISATGRGYASATPAVVELGIGDQVDNVRVMVDHALSISGVVVRKGTGAPVTGVHVGAFTMSGGGQQAQAPDPTDAKGGFEVVGVRPGSYIMAAFGEDHVPEIGKSIEVVDRDVTDVKIELDAGVTLSGRVEPGSEAKVELELAGEVSFTNMFQMFKLVEAHSETDASGTFVIHHVPSGNLNVTAHTDDGHAGSAAVTIGDTDQSGIVVRLEARASVSGRVVDTNRQPVGGVHVEVKPVGERHRMKMSMSGALRESTVTSDDGSFRIVGLEPGKVEMTATFDRFENVVVMTRDDDKKKPDRVEVELVAGVEHKNVTLTVEARDGVIRGTVIGGDRKPAADAWVSTKWAPPKQDGKPEPMRWWMPSSPPVLTGADGKFTIDKLRKGTYTVVVEGPRGSSRGQQDAVKTGDSVTLVLAPLGTLSGHVTSRGAPVTAYALSCEGSSSRTHRDVSAADGAYTLEHLAPGSYDCNVTSDAGTAAGKVDVSGAAQLDFTIAGWASLTGVVVNTFSHRPIAGVLAMVMGGSDFTALMSGKGPTASDATGHFVVGKVKPGKGMMTLMTKGSMSPLGHKDYTAVEGQRVDVGTIEIIPPRDGDAGTLGMVTTVDQDLVVSQVKAGGPAEQVGVRVGDKIVKLFGRPVTDIGASACSHFLESGAIGVGEVVPLELDRGGQTVQATVTSVKW